MIVWHLLRFWNGWFIIRIPLIQRRCVDTQFNISTCRAQLRWMKQQVYPPLDQPSSILFTPYRAWVVGDFRLTMRRWQAAAGHASNADRLTAVPDVDPNEPRCPWPHLYPEIRGQSYYFAHGHRSCAAAVLSHRDLLRRLPCHRCDSWVTTNRLPLTPTAAGPGIIFGTSSTVFRLPRFRANCGRPEVQSPARIPSLWLPSPTLPIGTFNGPNLPTTVVAAGARRFSGRIPAVHGCHFYHWQPRHIQHSRRYLSRLPAGLEALPIIGTCSGFHRRRRTHFRHDSGHLQPRFRLPSPLAWSPFSHHPFPTVVVLHRATELEFLLRPFHRCSGAAEP